MNKDRIEGKVKDIAGRVERQAGEWTGDPKTQIEGAAKQVEGKLQNSAGKVKDAVKREKGKLESNSKPPRAVTDSPELADEDEDVRRARG